MMTLHDTCIQVDAGILSPGLHYTSDAGPVVVYHCGSYDLPDRWEVAIQREVGLRDRLSDTTRSSEAAREACSRSCERQGMLEQALSGRIPQDSVSLGYIAGLRARKEA